MGRKHNQDLENQQADDAAATAILRALERKRVDREVLQLMTPREQQRVFDAEARHERHRRGQ